MNGFKSVLQDDTVLELLEDGAMFTLGSEFQFPDWEAMWKQELSRDDTKRPKGLHASDTVPSSSNLGLCMASFMLTKMLLPFVQDGLHTSRCKHLLSHSEMRRMLMTLASSTPFCIAI